jgi:hypothetical protein
LIRLKKLKLKNLLLNSELKNIPFLNVRLILKIKKLEKIYLLVGQAFFEITNESIQTAIAEVNKK